MKALLKGFIVLALFFLVARGVFAIIGSNYKYQEQTAEEWFNEYNEYVYLYEETKSERMASHKSLRVCAKRARDTAKKEITRFTLREKDELGILSNYAENLEKCIEGNAP